MATVVITRITTGWNVRVITEDASATTTVTFEQFDEHGQAAFEEAVEFLKSTIHSGY